MAKTVFGMPGAGKQETGGGDAVAPGGSPGAKQGGGDLPQKSGKEKPKLPLKPMQKPLAASPPQKKSSIPPLAAPSSPPPGGKPAAPKKAPANSAKTMFGMPAIKLPGPPGATPAAPDGDGTQPIGLTKDIFNSPATLPTAPAPNPAPAPEDDDAFKATVLGMSAADLSEGAQPVGPQTTSNDLDGLAQAPAVQPTAKSNAQTAPDFGEEPSSVRIGVGSTGIGSQGQLPKWAIAAIVAIVAISLFLVGFFMLGNSDSPATETKPTPSEAPATP